MDNSSKSGLLTNVVTCEDDKYQSLVHFIRSVAAAKVMVLLGCFGFGWRCFMRTLTRNLCTLFSVIKLMGLWESFLGHAYTCSRLSRLATKFVQSVDCVHSVYWYPDIAACNLIDTCCYNELCYVRWNTIKECLLTNSGRDHIHNDYTLRDFYVRMF